MWMTVDTSLQGDLGLAGGDSLPLKIFDGVRTIAINGSFKQTRNDRDSIVTLELDAEQQAIMVAAKQKGRITLTANPEGPETGGLNVEMSKNDRITLRQLLGIKSPEAPEAEEEPFITEQYRPGGRTDAAFDEDGRPWRGGRSSSGRYYGNDSNQRFGNGFSNSGDPTDQRTDQSAARDTVTQSQGSAF